MSSCILLVLVIKVIIYTFSFDTRGAHIIDNGSKRKGKKDVFSSDKNNKRIALIERRPLSGQRAHKFLRWP